MDRNIRLLGVGVGVRTFGNALYFPFLALFLQTVLHVSYFDIGLIFVGVGLVQLPFNFVGGLVTDRIGRRRLILGGLAGEAVFTLGLAYAFQLESLSGAIIAAALGGLVATVAGPAFAAYIADLAQGSERTRGFTWFRIGYNAGYSAGVTLGGFLTALLSFAWAVGVAAAVVAAGTILLLALLDPSPFDRVLVRGAVVARAGTDPPAPTRPPSRPMRESLRILARDRPALELLVAVVLAAMVAGQWVVTFPLYVHNVLGISYELLGLGLALNGLVVVFGQQPTTERVLGQRHTTIANAGLLFYALAFLGLGLAGLVSFYPLAVFFVAVVVLTSGENLITIPQATLPSNLAPKEEVGSYNGAFALVGAAGSLLAIFLGGIVLSLTTNPFGVWALLVLPVVPAIALFWDASRRIPREADRA